MEVLSRVSETLAKRNAVYDEDDAGNRFISLQLI